MSAAPRAFSQREYAAHRKAEGLPGTTHQAVSKAIRDGRLTAASYQRKGKRYLIDPVAADAEWAAGTLGSRTRDGQALSESRAAAVQRVDTGERTLFGDPILETQQGDSDGNPTSKADLDREHVRIRSELLALDLKERQGELVNKADVSTAVFTAFRQVREELLQLPERVADFAAAETDPVEVRAMLRAEVTATLTRLQDDADRI